MQQLFHKLFDIREGEGSKAFLMFSYIFMITASLLILKPIRSSLFLVKFGAEKLPYVFVLVALFSAFVALIYSRYSKNIRLNYLIIITNCICMLSLVGFWLLLHFGNQSGWSFYVFYIWVAIYGVITSAQFWLLANHVYNAREARRLFGFIGAGAISGGIFGGILTNILATRIKTENLIIFCIVFLAACIILLFFIWEKSLHPGSGHRIPKKTWGEISAAPENPVKMILKSRHLTYLTGLIGVGVVAANLADYQFSAVASRIITEADQLTAFFGFWMSTLSIVSLGIQLLITGRVMKYFGVATSLFFLPLGLLVGAITILIHPALWTAILIKVSDGSLKHSINKAGTELLSLPLPTRVKNKAKSFIDIFIKNSAKGIGGLLLIFLTAGLGFHIRYISLILIALIAGWIYLIFKVKKEYINSFREAIEKRTINLEQQSLNLNDAAALQSLFKILRWQWRC